MMHKINAILLRRHLGCHSERFKTLILTNYFLLRFKVKYSVQNVVQTNKLEIDCPKWNLYSKKCILINKVIEVSSILWWGRGKQFSTPEMMTMVQLRPLPPAALTTNTK